MNNYAGSIDTDMAIGTILSNFETAYIMNTIQNSLEMRFRPFDEPMPNYVDILNRQFEGVLISAPLYRDEILEVRTRTYQEIIECICDYYNLQFAESFDNIQPQELFGIAHAMYEVFVSSFTRYMVDFFIRYIINNADGIYNYLLNDENIRRIKEKEMQERNTYIDSKYVLIHQNLNRIVMDMTMYDITLNDLLAYFFSPAEYNRMSSLLLDKGNIYKDHYASFLLDQRYMANLLTVLKLSLQSHTHEENKLNEYIFKEREQVQQAPEENNNTPEGDTLDAGI